MEVPEALLAANQTAATVADAGYWERLCPHLTVSVKGRSDSGDGDGNAPGSGASAASDGETAAAEKDRSRGAGNPLHPNANAELALL